MKCDYCAGEAVVRIPENPGEVCVTHAIAFWTGLLDYARAHPPESIALTTEFQTARPSARRIVSTPRNSHPMRRTRIAATAARRPAAISVARAASVVS